MAKISQIKSVASLHEQPEQADTDGSPHRHDQNPSKNPDIAQAVGGAHFLVPIDKAKRRADEANYELCQRKRRRHTISLLKISALSAPVCTLC